VSDDRKKSWREIDRARESGSGGGRRRDPDEARRERAAKSGEYSAYKSQLDKLFTPGGAALPESLREKLGPQSEDARARRARLDALASDPSAATLGPVLAAGDPLPSDARLLMRLMDVRDPALLEPVLARLTELLEGGAQVNRMLLQQRIQATESALDDAEVTARLAALRRSLG
jgi:hypothetical protein